MNAVITKQAERTRAALHTLRGEFIDEGKDSAARTLDDFLLEAEDDSLARLYNIIMQTGVPAPLGATENIGSIPAD